ncbi:O-methyltransferase [Mycobacterium phage Hannaconda]|uniref:O-methyltransferase n=2 Tax=Omegavirus courthouse TaxID=1089119 RepID=G8I572_9CAUD|nr:methyltransferase [Mycobacterium phage Courthouse]YP_009213232.1 methyltransferase [Mycobacterium phage MiaZeal]ASD50657.1 O-methyltransferase [Mycobacterium phage Porcelain]ATS92858.1 methyltransferase [Mycobacterium phage Superphikiman]QGJ93655.1 O-methyltransferase [Mycobacterium phage Hannaconda]QPO16619.1 O-methyltransferase [Mycobacterium phage KashFlow]AER47866.1 O-methyltransferase [Mycobacterium phage Courthouse]
MNKGQYIEPVEHYALLRHVVGLCGAGVALEFGVAKGDSTRIIAESLPVIGFDSFEGLPEDWRPGYPKGKFAHDPPEIDNCTLVTGLFADTLPGFHFESLGRISLVHLDADLYSSTALALEHVGPHLQAGAYLVFDEFHGYAGCEEHEMRAFNEFVSRTGFQYSSIAHSHEAFAVKIV